MEENTKDLHAIELNEIERFIKDEIRLSGCYADNATNCLKKYSKISKGGTYFSPNGNDVVIFYKNIADSEFKFDIIPFINLLNGCNGIEIAHNDTESLLRNIYGQMITNQFFKKTFDIKNLITYLGELLVTMPENLNNVLSIHEFDYEFRDGYYMKVVENKDHTFDLLLKNFENKSYCEKIANSKNPKKLLVLCNCLRGTNLIRNNLDINKLKYFISMYANINNIKTDDYAGRVIEI